LLAGAHANVVVFKEPFSTNIHSRVAERIIVITHPTCKISNPKLQTNLKFKY
jgi:hypothetical protein